MKDRIRHILFPPGIDEYKQDFAYENLRSLTFILFAGFGVSLVLILFSYLLGAGFTIRLRTIGYLVFFAISVALRLSYRQEISAHATGALYVWDACLLAYSLIMGSVDPGSSPDYIYLFFLLVLPLLIRDALGRILILAGAGSLAFILVDVTRRQGDALGMDLIHLLMVLVVVVYLTLRILTERMKYMASSANAELKAEHDMLTGIYNRRGGESLIRGFLKDAVPGAYMIIDVDDFKHVNDTYGHSAGDETLKAVAHTLQNQFRDTDVVMRMGGDEFIVYAVGMADVHNVENKLESMREAAHGIVYDKKTGSHVTTSVGCIINLGSYEDYDSLYTAADQLLYSVKANGKDNYKCSDKECR